MGDEHSLSGSVNSFSSSLPRYKCSYTFASLVWLPIETVPNDCNVFLSCVIQIKVEAAEDLCDDEISLRMCKTARDVSRSYRFPAFGRAEFVLTQPRITPRYKQGIHMCASSRTQEYSSLWLAEKLIFPIRDATRLPSSARSVSATFMASLRLTPPWE